MIKTSRKGKEHPEVDQIKNICDVSPESKTTKDVCDRLKSNKKSPLKK